MKKRRSLRPVIGELILFALPIIAGHISHNLIGMGDMLVASRYSTQALAAIGLANGIMNPVMVIGVGLLIGIAPLLSKKRGEGVPSQGYLYSGLAYALILSAIIQILVVLGTLTLDWWGFDRQLVPIIREYILLFQWSIPGAMLFQAMKEILQAREDVLAANLIAILSVVVNITLNILLVFGSWGFPRLGINGLAIASIVSRWIMALGLWVYFLYRYREGWQPQIKFYQKVFTLSLPISLAIFAEVSFFGVTTLLIGQISTLQVAAHNIVLIICSFTFMVPLAISNAVSVKIGYALGRKDLTSILLYQRSSLIISWIFMGLMAILFCFFHTPILRIFSEDPDLIQVAKMLLIIGAFFQILDGTQITMAGVLRGLGITRPVFILILAVYWGFCLPLGYFMADHLKLNAMGFWIGIAIGLGMVAAGLLMIFRNRFRRVSRMISRYGADY
ncbi:MAG: MATE family efflux transporter [Candidatus Delongbacteria bacterium]|nr:MATE family efflux transporter [Candidatus Delongbacteria bacterium]